MADEGLTYAAAGVNLEAAAQTLKRIRPYLEQARRPEVLLRGGGFGGLFRLDGGRYRRPVLVAGADGVGTKLELAQQLERHETVGIDLVAMCVNDVLVQGAEPLFFLDYLATGCLDPREVEAVIAGVARGCQGAGCALLGGETAEMPGFLAPGQYELAGFAVGIVEEDAIVDGSSIQEGDVLLAFGSSGLHSNGFSLVRRVVAEAGLSLEEKVSPPGISLGEMLLSPTRIYVSPVLTLLQHYPIRGMAHITGGGLVENLPRILPAGLQACLDTRSWSPPPVFSYLQQAGDISPREMYRVFNMGLGLVLVVSPDVARAVEGACGDGEPWPVGRVKRAPEPVRIEGGHPR